MRIIEEANHDYESCADCIHSDDSEEICVLRRCIHAVSRLKECYVPKSPTIEPQRTGKWIDCDGSEHWKCDKCGCRAGYWFNEENSSSWELDMSEWLSDFCPNCGAKMEGTP